MHRLSLPLLLLLLSCSTSPIPSNPTPDSLAPDTLTPDTPDLRFADSTPTPDTPDFMLPDLPAPADLPDTAAQCAPGEGCFLDPCSENDDCLSNWCVGHMGEDVCTIECQSECPPGWSCQQVPGTAPDVVWLCISDHANLCLPCNGAADCKGTAGADSACIDYADHGAFCGGTCSDDDDCPWGFSCTESTTTDGIALTQCVADAGVCPCTKKSVELGLWTACESANEFGTCTGKRICTADGLTACDAPLPAAETCNGIDDDCDGETDEATCNDDNECTDDSCLGADGCVNTALEAVECKDGDPCTVADHCADGACIGTPVECNDDNPCTDDLCTAQGGCEFVPIFGPCDDADPCTAGDLCQDGQCAGTPLDCTCQADADCDSLEDGNLCNGTLFCDTATLPYRCAIVPESVIACESPTGPDAPCLAAQCDPESGQCAFVPANDGAPCSDNDACTIADTCANGVCTPGPALNCNDANPCTDDACEPESGCQYTENTLPCNDDNACTTQDTCTVGTCQGGPALNCDDANPCTDDTCDPVAGCQHAFNAAPCDDSNACTTGDVCQQGACAFAGFLACDDGNPCTKDSCAPQTGCVFTMTDAPCDDGNVCTLGDHCHLGECISSQSLSCDDANPCTDDACAPASGCKFTPNQAPCDDANACTQDDQCGKGWCNGQPADCDDSNPCTDDLCDPESGCTHTPNAIPCDDGDQCTVADQCAAGACMGGEPLSCEDSNVCTDDSCDPATGCQFLPNDVPCSDNDACTTSDQCSQGACSGTPLDCDDAEPCTTDTCDPATGCLHTPQPDQTPCGPQMHCESGICTAISQQVDIDTLNFNGMSGWPLRFDNKPYCSPTTDQEQMDALCQLAGYTTATNWVYQTKQITTCYCWGSCSNFKWQSQCCSGLQTQEMITSVTCQ